MSLRSRTVFSSGRACAPPAPLRAVRMVVRAAQKQQPIEMLQQQISAMAKPAVLAAVANAIMAMPASATVGKLFDFNLTLPAMVAEFLLLMVCLEKFWFTPVGKVLDDRDALIREKLGAVKGDSGGVETLILEAENVLKAARMDVSKSINQQKADKQSELDKLYSTAKDMVNKETDAAMANLDKESAGVLQKLDAQVDKIGNEVLRRVLPAGVKV